MKARGGLIVLSLLIPAGAAWAAQAVSGPVGDNVVVIAVTDVNVPATLPGECVSRGMITQVVAGSRFHAGQAIAIKVACGHRTPIIDEGPARPVAPEREWSNGSIDANVVAQSKKAVVRLDDTGAVIWQPPAAFPDDRFAQFSRVAGYTALDGVKLPLSRRVS